MQCIWTLCLPCIKNNNLLLIFYVLTLKDNFGSKNVETMLSGKNVLITGASRGLGLEVVRQLLKNPKGTLPQSPSVVIATCRNPDNAPELQALAAEEHNRLYIKKLDVTNFESYLGFMKDELEVSFLFFIWNSS